MEGRVEGRVAGEEVGCRASYYTAACIVDLSMALVLQRLSERQPTDNDDVSLLLRVHGGRFDRLRSHNGQSENAGACNEKR